MAVIVKTRYPEELKNLPEVQKMPSFPSKGCVLMTNGIAIVKLPV